MNTATNTAPKTYTATHRTGAELLAAARALITAPGAFLPELGFADDDEGADTHGACPWAVRWSVPGALEHEAFAAAGWIRPENKAAYEAALRAMHESTPAAHRRATTKETAYGTLGFGHAAALRALDRAIAYARANHI